MRNIILSILWFMTIWSVHSSNENKFEPTEFTWKKEFKFDSLDDLFFSSDNFLEDFFYTDNFCKKEHPEENLNKNLFGYVKQEDGVIFSKLSPSVDTVERVIIQKLSSPVNEEESVLDMAHLELFIPDELTFLEDVISQDKDIKNEQLTDQKNNIYSNSNNKRKKSDDFLVIKNTKKIKSSKRGRKPGAAGKNTIKKESYKKITTFAFKNINTLKYKDALLESINDRDLKDNTFYAAFSQIRYLIKTLFRIQGDQNLDQRARKNALLILETIADVSIDVNKIQIKKRAKGKVKVPEVKNIVIEYLIEEEISANIKNDYLLRMLNHLKKIILYFDISLSSCK